MKYIESIIFMFSSLFNHYYASLSNFENHIVEFSWTHKEIKVMFRKGNKS